VRYNLPPPPEDIPKSEAELKEALEQEAAAAGDEEPEEEAPRSLRPGQKGFAQRLMSKYGWTKGTGLGASNSGIINPLRVQVEKQKKKPDSEGGGFVGPGGRGKIIGGKKKGGDDAGKFGAMSDVIKLENMLSGMDVAHELNEGNLRQEIGEECGEKVCNSYITLDSMLTYHSTAASKECTSIRQLLTTHPFSSNLLASFQHCE
jgi:splicing factor 45